MSDPIGGSGGGGGGFDIQGLLGSIGGMVGQAKGGGQQGGTEGAQQQGGMGGGLQGMLDPLGLFPMLGGLIGQITKGADVTKISDEGKFTNNEIAAFQQSQNGLLAAPGEDPAQTTYAPPLDKSKVGDGYAPENLKEMSLTQQRVAQDAMDKDQKPGRATSESKATADDASPNKQERVTSSDAQVQTVQTEEQKQRAAALAEEKKNVEYIYNHFSDFDISWPKDGTFDEADLAMIVAQGKTQPQKDAALYLLKNPDLMNSLMTATGRGNGLIGLDAIRARNQALMGMVATGIKTTDPVGGAGATGGTGGAGGAGSTGGAGGTGRTPPVATKTPKTLDEALRNISDDMNTKQKDFLNAKGEGKTPEEITIMKQELTSLMQSFQEMYELINNLRKSFHEMSMHSIGHISR